MKFCYCPASKFKMGSSADEAGHREAEDQVDVTLTQGFWLGKTEVTQGQWKAVMGTTPWKGENYVVLQRYQWVILNAECVSPSESEQQIQGLLNRIVFCVGFDRPFIHRAIRCARG
jgi:formylglycine-generating enzyme required for sulfatase activity